MLRPGPYVNAPAFPKHLTWLNSEGELELSALRGKIVLLEFWTYYCINCLHNLPQLRRLLELFPKELVIIGVHSGKFPAEQASEHIRSAILRNQITWPVVNDHELQIWSEYAIKAWPSTVLLNERGKIVAHLSGEFLADELAPSIRELIAQADAKGSLKRGAFVHTREPAQASDRALSFPSKLALHPDGRLFVADSGQHRILELQLDERAEKATLLRSFGSGKPELYDAIGERAGFQQPHGLALHGDTLYVADSGNHAIRAIDLNSGAVRTLAGTGNKAHSATPKRQQAALNTELRSPWDLLFRDGKLYIAMAGSHQIWTLSNDYELEAWAGVGFEGLLDGARLGAGFNQPSGLACGVGQLFVADAEASAIRAIPFEGQDQVTTLIGQGLFSFGDRDGRGDEVRLQHPTGLAYYGGMLFIADGYNHKIKLLDPSQRQVSSLIGSGQAGDQDGPFQSASLYEPDGLAVYLGADQPMLLIADSNNHLIRVAELTTGQLRTLELQGVTSVSSSAGLGQRERRLYAQVRGERFTLQLKLHLPPDRKANPEAPLQIRHHERLLSNVVAPWEGRTLTLDLPSEPKLALDLMVYSCDREQEQLCYIQHEQLLFEIERNDQAGDSLEIEHKIVA